MSRRSELERAVERFLDDKSKRGQSGNYRRNAGRVLRDFVEWLENGQPTHEQREMPDAYGGGGDGEPVERAADLRVSHFADYARLLRSRAYDDDTRFSAASARTYYSYLRAWGSWAVDEELLEENLARKNRATKRLPDDDGTGSDQQMWSPEQRRAVLEYVEERAREEIDANPRSHAALKAARDRALVALFAYSGLRGGEFLRDPHDDRRDGATWADLRWPQGTAPGDDATQSLREAETDTAGTLEVLGKSQEREPATVLAQAFPALRRYYRLLSPPTDAWPLFPTFHTPSLYDALRDDDVDVEDLSDHPLVVCREADVMPPASTTRTGRSVMQRVCEDAGLDLADGVSYLEPHGGRRGLGDEVYQQDPRLAQDVLRHQDISTTQQAYRERKAEEDAAKASELLDE